jgi:hypothetical protein
VAELVGIATDGSTHRMLLGSRSSVVVKALGYKSKGRGFNPRVLDLPNSSLGFIKIIMYLGSKVRRVRMADNLTAIWADCLDNVGSLISHNPIGLQGLLRE